MFDQAILMGGNAESYWAISSRETVSKICQKKALKLGFQRTGSEGKILKQKIKNLDLYRKVE